VGSIFHFACPFITAYYVVRTIAAGYADQTTILLISLILPVTVLFCCGMGCCRASFCASLWVGMALMAAMVVLALMNDGDKIHLDGIHHPNRSVAVVGGGPSGATAAWILAQDSPHAQIDVYEYSPKLGGHSDTVMGDFPDPLTGGNTSHPIDIGFIFSTPGYYYYNALTDLFNYSRKQSTISVHFHGDETKNQMPWTNQNGDAGAEFTSTAGAKRARVMTEDLQRFERLCSRDMSMLEMMVPLDVWLWYHGFSRDFYYSALLPMLTPLFVTQNGNAAQSSGATCTHFSKERGFLSFNRSDHPPVLHTVGGVQFMYEAMLQQVTDTCATCAVRTNSDVFKVAPSRGGWTVTTRDRISGDVTSREYDEVVLACNAHIAERLLSAGGDGEIAQWPQCHDASPFRTACRQSGDNIFRALRSWAMRNTEYEWADVTLSKTSANQPEQMYPSLYHIWAGGVMTGAIDKILDLTPASNTARYRLRVAPDGVEDVNPDVTPVLARRRWEHHRFNLWEHLLVFRILAHFNNYDGLHVAGDWTRSVGQNAAVESGVRAACAIGLRPETKQMLTNIGINTTRVLAC